MTEEQQTMRLAFCDCETTGLDPDVHEIWEVGLIVDDVEHHWLLPVDLGRADPVALKIGRFYERHPQGRHGMPSMTPVDLFAGDFARLTRGCMLVGAVPSFDEERLRRLLRRNGACPEWHYQLLDVETLCVGHLLSRWAWSERALPYSPSELLPPWDSSKLCEWMGVEVDESEKHTALGDARWAKALYERCFELTS